MDGGVCDDLSALLRVTTAKDIIKAADSSLRTVFAKFEKATRKSFEELCTHMELNEKYTPGWSVTSNSYQPSKPRARSRGSSWTITSNLRSRWTTNGMQPGERIRMQPTPTQLIGNNLSNPGISEWTSSSKL